MTELERLRAFAAKMLEGWPERDGLDGGDLQDAAVEAGLLVPTNATEPCGENCWCAEYYGDFPVTCYRHAAPESAPAREAELARQVETLRAALKDARDDVWASAMNDWLAASQHARQKETQIEYAAFAVRQYDAALTGSPVTWCTCGANTIAAMQGTHLASCPLAATPAPEPDSGPTREWLEAHDDDGNVSARNPDLFVRAEPVDRAAIVEQCARVAEEWQTVATRLPGERVTLTRKANVAKRLAAAIRALAPRKEHDRAE